MNITNNAIYTYGNRYVGVTKNSLSLKGKQGEDNTVTDGRHYRQERTEKGITPRGAFDSMRNSGGKVSGATLSAQMTKDSQRVENDDYIIELSDEIQGHWRIYDKENDDYVLVNPRSTEIQTDNQTGKKYLISKNIGGGLIDAMVMDDSLEDILKDFIGTKNLAVNPLDDRYELVEDDFTRIQCLKLKGAEGNGSRMMINGKEQQKKLQELADIYRNKYPNLVQSDELAMGMAIMEVNGFAKRTENGIFMMSDNGMDYMDENDQSKGWAVLYSRESGEKIYQAIMGAISSGVVANMEDFSNWTEFFEKNEFEYEKNLTDEERAALEAEKKQEIAVSAEKLIEKLKKVDVWTDGVPNARITDIEVVSLADEEISFYYNTDTGELKCIDDNASKPGQNLWKMTLSLEEYEKCTPLFERYKGETQWQFYYGAYLRHEDFWKMYLQEGFDIDKADAILNAGNADKEMNIHERAFLYVGKNAPERVYQAWMEAAKEIGVNGLGMQEDGKLGHISRLMKQRLLSDDKNILGNSVESAIEAIKNALYDLGNVMETGKTKSSNVQELREKEKAFYEAFLGKLEQQ